MLPALFISGESVGFSAWRFSRGVYRVIVVDFFFPCPSGFRVLPIPTASTEWVGGFGRFESPAATLLGAQGSGLSPSSRSANTSSKLPQTLEIWVALPACGQP